MSHALHQSLQVSHKVLLVGSDCPVLTRGYFEQALTALDTNKVVSGASEDGDTCCLAHPLAGLWEPAAIQGRPMGQPVRVATEREAFSEVKQCVLPPLWDVDLPDDVSRACELRLLPATFLEPGWRKTVADELNTGSGTHTLYFVDGMISVMDDGASMQDSAMIDST